MRAMREKKTVIKKSCLFACDNIKILNESGKKKLQNEQETMRVCLCVVSAVCVCAGRAADKEPKYFQNILFIIDDEQK